MLISPQPRFRFYIGFRNYGLVLRDIAAGRVFKGDAAKRLSAALQNGWM